MAHFDNIIFNYAKVKGDYLKETNDNTRRIWNDSIKDGYKDIIDITDKDDEEKIYLVDTTVYHNLLQASKEGEGIDPYGISNVNFTLINRDDKRWEEFKKQRLERGFDDSETWSLDSTITNFILPRLKCFKDNHCGYPGSLTDEKWNDILNKMVMAFEYLNDEKLGVDNNLSYKECNEERDKVINRGLRLFCKYYSALWW